MEEIYELTNPQKSIYLTEQYFQNTTINNICGSVLIKENVDLKLLNTAINYFIQNNDSFKLRFKLDDTKLVQYFTKDEFYNFEVINIKKESQIETFAKKEVNTKFDLLGSRLFNFKLFKLPSGFGGFIINSHHIISDAATLSLLATEIMQNYSKLLKNEPIEDKPYSYVDYINSEKQYLTSSRFSKDKKYWDELLNPLPDAATFLPTNSTTNDSPCAKREEFVLDIVLVNKIKQYCLKNNISLYNFLIAIYAIYFGQINNMETFTLGTPVLNRASFNEKHTSGMFINTSILKIDISNNIEFKEFVKNISKDTLGMLKHQKYNYQFILNEIRKKDKSIPNLYDIMLSYQVTGATDNTIDVPYIAKWYGTDYISNTLNVHFHDNDGTGSLIVSYDYKVSKISSQEIDKMHKRIIDMFKQVISNDAVLIHNIDIITNDEKNELLNVYNNNSFSYPKDKDLIQIFKDVVQKRPHKTALVFEDKKISYQDLDNLSDSLANYLSSFDINFEDKIALFYDKSIEVFVSILAILKLNAAFVPIDIDYPQDRIKYILKDSNCKLCLTTLKLRDKISDLCKTICTDALNLYNRSLFIYKPKSISSLAYVMYTSGSTGRPKGVMIEQKSIIRLVKNPNYIKFAYSERILQTGSIVFDACTFEIWAALLNGFPLYILKKEDLLNPIFLGKYIQKNKISILWLTAPLFNQLSDINPVLFKGVKYLLTGGDVLSPKHINKVMSVNPKLKIINGYGPTENTTFTCCFNIDKKYENNIPIGKPISGTTCFVTSKVGNLLPLGIPGELLVGGDGVSRGYLNKDNLTKEKFIQNPFDKTSIMYKTGDLVKWNKNKTIDFIGRIDNQVKIRGFRVELNEINNTILSYPNIKNSVTIIQTINGSKEICSYIVPKEEITIDDLKNYLKEYMPTYMVPNYFKIMDEFPITINGKIDTKKLPAPTLSVKNKEITEPKTTFEIEIYEIIKKMVGYDEFSTTDNFFDDLNMDSLSSMELCSNLYKYDVSIQDISDYPTIQQLANKIEKHLKVSHFENILPKIDIKNEKFDFNLSNCLLTGSLGFLGMHILRELLLCNKVENIYLLVRDKGNVSYEDRFKEALNYYFKDDLKKETKNKVKLISGDFSLENLGIEEKQYKKLTKKVTTVIHCGANVKHYGKFQSFMASNVKGVQNIIEFCKNSNSKLAHISTVSVGGYQENTENVVLSENDFNINQTFNNHVYMITKYLAEYHVLSAINNSKLQAKIFRIGNIMPRYSDSVFQPNAKDNAMFSRLKTIIKLGKITKEYENLLIDFSPVDLCANAIMKIMQSPSKQTIYHIYNNNQISLKDFLKKGKINLNHVNAKDFINELQTLKSPLASHLLNDMQSTNIHLTEVTNDLTTNFLAKKGFMWNNIDNNYIKNLIDMIN